MYRLSRGRVSRVLCKKPTVGNKAYGPYAHGQLGYKTCRTPLQPRFAGFVASCPCAVRPSVEASIKPVNLRGYNHDLVVSQFVV